MFQFQPVCTGHPYLEIRLHRLCPPTLNLATAMLAPPCGSTRPPEFLHKQNIFIQRSGVSVALRKRGGMRGRGAMLCCFGVPIFLGGRGPQTADAPREQIARRPASPFQPSDGIRAEIFSALPYALLVYRRAGTTCRQPLCNACLTARHF
jgi:hypothetical protein